MDNSNIVFKIVIVGDSNVGKTSILSQYGLNIFEKNTNPTIGCDFLTKKIKLNENVVYLQIWDLAGNNIFNAINKLILFLN